METLYVKPLSCCCGPSLFWFSLRMQIYVFVNLFINFFVFSYFWFCQSRNENFEAFFNFSLICALQNIHVYPYLYRQKLKRLEKSYIYIYYIDTNVLLKNIPPVKFIKTASGTRAVFLPLSHTWVYRWRNFGNFPLLLYRCLFVYIIIKKYITQRLGDTNFIFSWQKQYFTRSLRSFVISSRHRVISSIYFYILFHFNSYQTSCWNAATELFGRK